MTDLSRHALPALLVLFAGHLHAQLVEGPGRQELGRLCKGCHEVERSVSRRQDRDGWHATMNKMVALGMKGSDSDIGTVLEYLVKNYPPEDVPRVNVNKATPIELESGLSLRRSQAAAIIAFREKNGEFKTLDDLKKVPNLDPAKIDAKKDRIAF